MTTGSAPRPLSRTEEDRRLWGTFRMHSRTFSLAARLLPRDVRLPIATLYVFCRRVDTIADERILEVGLDQARRELDRLRAELEHTLAGRPPDELLWRRLALVHERFGLPATPLHELIEGASWDLEGRPIETADDLLRYSDLVGGTVGAMTLPFLVADPAHADGLETPARALGTAMQLTNIMRDVGEDRRVLGRVYLPAAWLDEHALAPGMLARERPPAGYAALAERVMEAAEDHYRRALPAIDRLSWRVRPAIRGAARMYREIMNEVRAAHYDNLSRRAYVPLGRKLRLLVQDDYARRRAALRAAAPSGAVVEPGPLPAPQRVEA